MAKPASQPPAQPPAQSPAGQKAVTEHQAQLESIHAQLESMQTQLLQSQERERRALADYQNLVRRQQEDRLKLLKFANKELIEQLVQPLDHLSLAAHQLADPGLTMVVEQLWATLKQAGLEEFDPLGQPFDVATMEVVDQQSQGETVLKVVKRGYRLNGEVIQHARVIVGDHQPDDQRQRTAKETKQSTDESKTHLSQ